MGAAVDGTGHFGCKGPLRPENVQSWGLAGEPGRDCCGGRVAAT